MEREIEGIPYKVGVGSLMYAMVAMKADIVFAVSTVIQFMSKAGSPHWMAVKHILRYLKGTLDFKSCLGGKDIVLRGFCDADWVGDANYWRSNQVCIFCWPWSHFMETQETTNYCIIYDGNRIHGY